MSELFDPYHKWLGIKPEDQPPNHYRLLGIDLFETDPEVVDAAASRQMAHVRSYQLGPHSALSQKILNEIAAAKVCLLTPSKKDGYDAELRTNLGAGTVPVNLPPIYDVLSPPPAALPIPTSHQPIRRRKRRHSPLMPLAAFAVILCFGMTILTFSSIGKKEPAGSNGAWQSPKGMAVEPPREPSSVVEPAWQPSHQHEESLQPKSKPVIPSSPPANPLAAPTTVPPPAPPTPILAQNPQPLVESKHPTGKETRKEFPAFAHDAPAKIPAPDAIAQEKATALVRELYKEKFDVATTVQQKRALAVELLDKAKAVRNDLPTHYVLLNEAGNLSVKAGDAKTALQVIDEMDQTFQIDAAKMKLAVLNALQATWKAEGQTTEEEPGVKSGSSQCSQVLKDSGQQRTACGKPLAWWLSRALEESSRVSEREKPSVCIAIVERIARTGDFAEARRRANEIESLSGRAVALGKVAAWQILSGNAAGGRAAFVEVVSLAEQAGSGFTTIAQMQHRTGDTNGAKRTLVVARQKTLTGATNRKGAALDMIARTQARIGDFRGAIATANAIDDRQHQEWARLEIARQQAKVGDFADAVATSDLLYPVHKKRCLVVIAIYTMKNGDLQKLKARAMAINDPFATADTLLELGAAQAANRQLEAALATLRDAEKIADNYREDFPRNNALRRVVRSTCKIMEMGRQELDWARSVANKMGKGYRAMALTYIARSQAKVGDVAGAKQTLVSCLDDFFVSREAIRWITKAQCRSKESESLLEWIDWLGQQGREASRPGNRAFAYLGVVDGLLPDDELLPETDFVAD